MNLDTMYMIADEPIPSSWVLTVRKCTCGQTLFFDREKKTWHCMKTSCPNYKSHIQKVDLPKHKVDKILAFGDTLTIKQISDRVKVPEKDVFNVLREHGVL